MEFYFLFCIILLTSFNHPTSAGKKIPLRFWQQEMDECSPYYSFKLFGIIQIPDQASTKSLKMKCPDPPPGRAPLYWMQEVRSCAPCFTVSDSKGNPCNCSV
ncbi:unnamed protein product [Allacma fusca]|uniref:Uncharacterized protein n=1 Tax=Allacma fusca TaxID=39272 RepID=A0A8J2LJ78_9HEXA|nr:unnamed protein product [Allacma fusca]